MDVWSVVSTLFGVLIAAILLLAIAIITVGAVAAITLAVINSRINEVENGTAADHPSRHLRAVD